MLLIVSLVGIGVGYMVISGLNYDGMFGLLLLVFDLVNGYMVNSYLLFGVIGYFVGVLVGNDCCVVIVISDG